MNSPSGNSCTCQFCVVCKMCTEIKWPVPCRETVEELKVSSARAHILLTQIRTSQGRNANINTNDMLNSVKAVLNSLDKTNAQRLAWWWKEDNCNKRAYWKSEMEKEARREKYERLPAAEEGKMRKSLQAMQSINTKAKNQIAGIDTKMGYFCRHVIGGVDPDALRDGGALQMEEEEEPVKEEMHN
ncbi:hypothetical protein EG328_004802 [Venturia inaequalis]|uniref:Uncharacterized protein n=1 Tax=Venturia inaequalis TaxID=5025 RepID=A0A8H3Z641_VENIN|nr:hypothetical protein EG327_007877 [Venturia inaequalis]KAE9986784.1 hypothetical protein EG328_004802 [Venturia inaequalis]RDI87324.1 hypothetical protein Vi05172_g2682 [Venturia inaequalis]